MPLSRLLSFVLGPELFWIALCVAVQIATRRHLPPTMKISSWLDHHCWWLPLIFVPLTFAWILLPGTNRWLMLLRVDATLALGLVFAGALLCNGMAYHQSMARLSTGSYLIIPAMGYAAGIFGTGVAALLIWWRSRGVA